MVAVPFHGNYEKATAPGSPFQGGKLVARSFQDDRGRRGHLCVSSLQPAPTARPQGLQGTLDGDLPPQVPGSRDQVARTGLKNNQKCERIRTFFGFLPITQEQAPGPGSQVARSPGLSLHRWTVCVQTQPPAPGTHHWAVPQPRPQHRP